MDPSSLIPTAEAIPAPVWLLLTLDVLLWTLHILMVNVVLGGSLILLFFRLKKTDIPVQDTFHGAIATKVPTAFALAVNLGIAPLLFMQVIYGHLFYSSSVLMAVYWILVIPFLILAYYGAYIHIRKFDTKSALSKIAIVVTSILLLYIAFMFVNNMTLMAQPEKWTAYFSERGGTILNLSEPTLIPRYLHFVLASIAIAGLFLSMIWSKRRRIGIPDAEAKIKNGLRIFGYATTAQIVIGLWFLIALPRDMMLMFMGGNLFFTIVFTLGFLSSIGSIATAFANKLRPTVSMLIFTMITMVLMRDYLRTLYIDPHFQLSSLQLDPQYGVMTLFFVILLIGLAFVGYMIKIFLKANERRTA